MTELASYIWGDYNTDRIPSSGFKEPKKRLIREWGTWIEGALLGTSVVGRVIHATRASLYADLAHAANTMAWVWNDPTTAYNGIYAKVGASGSGSWTRLTDLPYSFLAAQNDGDGTANAIEATTPSPIPDGNGRTLITLPIFATNTNTPVTVEFNEDGSPLTIKTSAGNDPVPGGLVAGMIVAGWKDGSTFRMLSDQTSAAIQAAAEDAADRAEAAAAGIAITTCATRTELKALDPSLRKLAVLREAGREGTWVWRTGDYAAQIAADTAEGLYLKADSVAASAGAWVRVYDGAVRPTWFGAPANGVDDDRPALEAIDAIMPYLTTREVDFGNAAYRVSRVSGTDDRWGAKITQSGTKWKGSGASLRRYNTSISSSSNAYPILFVGVPDSNVADPVRDVVIEGFRFIGEDTRHAISGSYVNDLRDAIHCKNTTGFKSLNNTFDAIDSQAIYFQAPACYNYAASRRYNTTKNYDATIRGCTFNGTPHEVAGRALIHAIAVEGIDDVDISHNRFSWCDDAVAGETTYESLSQLDGSQWTPVYVGWSLGDVNRSGRGWRITANHVVGSTEHAFYVSGMDVVVANNTISTERPDLQTTGDMIKCRSKHATITGNIIRYCASGIGIHDPARCVTVTGNEISICATAITAGAIDIDSVGLSTFISARPWLSSYEPIRDIIIAGNVIELPEGEQATSQTGVGLRIYTDSADANYPNGQVQNVKITGNTFRNVKHGVLLFNAMIREIAIDGNSFIGKPFTRSGFNSGTTLYSQAALTVRDSVPTTNEKVVFRNNWVEGFAAVCDSIASGGTNVDLPRNMSGNHIEYVKRLFGTDTRVLGAANGFSGNTGVFVLQRDWSGHGIGNALGDGATTNSYLRFRFFETGSELRFYTNDSGTYRTL
jgi:hypothetical protein